MIRFGLNSPNARNLAGFYEKAFGALITRFEDVRPDSFSRWPGRTHAGAQRLVLRLGDSVLEVLQWDTPGASYPGDLSPYDTRFQHLALVVSDMAPAVQHLLRVPGWAPISTQGPETLPPSTGSVIAFKFRDPDGHPLELLQFPEEKIPTYWKKLNGAPLFLGFDHSAMSVHNVAASVAFYESLGLARATQTLNRGLEQQRLDGIDDPHVDVIGMSPAIPTPHVELLHYRTPTPSLPALVAYNDTAATRLVFSQETARNTIRGLLIRDPDGHLVELLG